MSLCVVDGKACRCQPEEGKHCPPLLELAKHCLAWIDNTASRPEHQGAPPSSPLITLQSQLRKISARRAAGETSVASHPGFRKLTDAVIAEMRWTCAHGNVYERWVATAACGCDRPTVRTIPE